MSLEPVLQPDAAGAGLSWRSRWQAAIGCSVVAFAAIAVAYSETIALLLKTWDEEGSYGHGFLLVPISAFLVWRDRGRIRATAPDACWWGLVFVVVGAAGWCAATLLAIQVGEQVGLLCVLFGTVLTIFGRGPSRYLLFPVAYLITGIPIWSQLIPVLQENTASAAATMLQALGIPVYLEGFYLSIPEGRFVVAEVCAGLRYLLATIAIAALYAYMNLFSNSRRIAFFVIAVLLSIVFNWIRVLVIIVAGHLSEMQHALVHSHISFGWVMFAVGLVPLFLIGEWLQRAEERRGISEPAGGSAVASSGSAASIAVAGVIVTAAAIAAPLFAAQARSAWVADDVAFRLPARLGAWERVGEEVAWQPRFRKATRSDLARYTRNGESVSLFVAWYVTQRQGAELINDHNVVHTRGRRGAVERRALEVAVGHDIRIAVRETRLAATEGMRRVTWHWFRVGDDRTASRLGAKLLQLKEMAMGRTDAAVIAVSTVAEDDEVSRARLRVFLDSTVPGIRAELGRLRSLP